MASGIRLFLDIRSGSVAAAIAGPGEGQGTYNVSYSRRRNFPILPVFKGERLLSSMLGEIKELLLGVRAVNSGPFAKVHVTIGSPWFFSETKTIKHLSDTPTKCERGWLDKTIDTEVSEFIHRNFNGRKPEIIERILLRVSLNGYETTRPFGRIAQEQEFTIYVSAVESSTVNTIRHAVAEILGPDKLEFHTQPICSFPAALSS